jgi:epoxyqueuosine reductase QueG
MTDARLDVDEDATGSEIGIDPAGLADEDLFRELASLYRTRLQTLRHGPEAALGNHLRRTAELETEYQARYPGREVDPDRLTQDF